jgi:hypothetical protein
MDDFWGDGEAGVITGRLVGPGAVVLWIGGGGVVKVFAKGLGVVRHLCNWESGLDALIASVVIVEVKEGLSLGARIIIH